MIFNDLESGEPGLMDRVLALHAGFDFHRGHMSERFFRSNRPGYPHPVSSELENSGIRVAVGDCSVTERRRWYPPYQAGKTVHVHAKHYKHNEDGRTAPGACGNGSVPLGHSGERRYENWNTHNDLETKPQKQNWASLVRDLLCRSGFQDFWLFKGVGNINIFLSTFKSRMRDMFMQDRHSRLENSMRARFYLNIENFQYQKYLDIFKSKNTE